MFVKSVRLIWISIMSVIVSKDLSYWRGRELRPKAISTSTHLPAVIYREGVLYVQNQAATTIDRAT